MSRSRNVLPILFLITAASTWPQTRAKAHPWSDTALSPDARAALVLREMTLDEKIQLVHGAGLQGFGPADASLARSNGGGGFVPGIARLGIPDFNMDDSAVGVGGGAKKGRYSTALPSSLALASSWDSKLAREYGTLIGRELGEQGYNVSLAGGVDITRDPRNGRNFEYMGEDPILAGNMVAELIEGVQSQHIIGDVKHYALNDQETGRAFVNSELDERSMRESDLLAFEIAVRRAHPGMVMCSYNLVNGTHSCESDYLLNKVLKQAWGFQGWVISDWFGTHSAAKAALAGLDQEQPGFTYFGEPLKKAVKSGAVPAARLDDMVRRILRTEFASGIIDQPPAAGVPDIFAGFATAQRIEEESAVLLKNEDHLLPLMPAVASIAIIGAHADREVLSGGGSAQVDPPGAKPFDMSAGPTAVDEFFRREVWDPSSPLEAIQSEAPHAQVTYADGHDIKAAAELARTSTVAVVFAYQHMHEGNDAPNLELPGEQNKLIAAVAAANPKTIVVLETGGPVAMPWIEKTGAVLEAWYPGIRGAQAIGRLLFGEVAPSGKLAVSFAKNDAELAHRSPFAPAGPPITAMDGTVGTHAPFNAPYKEGLKVGYKWFDAEGKTPLFPFGFGLSYTTFAYSDLHVSQEDRWAVSFQVKNGGDHDGVEIAQVYLEFPQSAGEPPKRLIGWSRVAVKAGETATVSLAIEPWYCAVFDVEQEQWKIAGGQYRVLAGPSSQELPLTAEITVQEKDAIQP